MNRLFVAIDLPDDLRQELAALLPTTSPGVRLTSLDQMHVTLHYIGIGDSDRIASALCSLSEPRFSLSIQGVGRFHSADRSITLWAGIDENDDLRRLHASVAKVLSVVGFRPEERPYTPHVTLARCDPLQTASMIDDFLARHAHMALPAVSITKFGLYSSVFVDGVPVYRRERCFPLDSPDHKSGD
jgi:2'-5' RNA ligase